MKINCLVLVLLLFGVTSYAQNGMVTPYWSSHKTDASSRIKMDIPTKKSTLYNLNYAALAHKLTRVKNSTTTLEVPIANNSFETFQLKPVEVMSPELARKYPNIKTYEAVNADGSISGRFDITPKGFHGMLFTPEGTVYIDPINLNNRNVYQCYYKKDYVPYAKTGIANDQLTNLDSKIDPTITGKQRIKLRSSGTELRTYRLAITTTGEYTTFHGGTVPDALAAIVTTMNRVNGIYEREVSIRMVLIGNTDDLIYTNAATDPYTNNSADSYIDEVQANIDAIIGNANYDIGHGFSTGAGGLAGQGPCNPDSKATGVTGTNSPIGDPFDVDYVAHEIGHQFGANHTFNGSSGSCSGSNRNASTAYEPGSGTTILAYAGICEPQNIQSNSDPYFHAASYDEILAYSVEGTGNGCATVSPTGNNAPTVEAGQGGFTIPINTPFKLTGSGSDPDGQNLTFSWEEFDLGSAGEPNSPSGNAPIFRSFSPKTDSSRYFPDLSDIVNNTQTIGELLPSYSRSMTFRLTVRDNQNGGGGVNYDEISFDVTDQAGPFVVSSFNTDTTLFAQTNVDISWDVANTNQNPVNCQSVSILLSEDGGLTYPHIIKSNTPNDGAETILLPNIVTTSARIMVKAADNIFFDINNTNINIETPAIPDFSITSTDEFLQVCAPDQVNTEVTIGSILGFSNEVTLEAVGLTDGLTAEFSVNPVAPGNSSTMQILNTDIEANGTYQLSIKATENGNSKSVSLRLDVYDEATETIELLSPTSAQFDVSLYPVLSWVNLEGINEYDVELATDDTFSAIVQSKSSISSSEFSPARLTGGTEYFWRVMASNICQTTSYSVGSFTTVATKTYQSEDAPVIISSSGSNTITSILNITDTGLITDLNVIGLSGKHSYISDLTVTLISPLGTEVILFDKICGSQRDFDLNLDQQSPITSIPCPPTGMDFYQPLGKLSDFNGEEINGTWTLSITDNFNQDGGQLLGWSLEAALAGESSPPDAPTELTGTLLDNLHIDLKWKDNASNEQKFVIERSKSDNTNFQEVASISLNSVHFEDSTLTELDTYFYRVKASNAGGSSGFSNEISISNIPPPPAAPSDLNVRIISIEQINLEWVDNADNETGYIIERSKGGNTNYQELITVAANNTTFQDSTLGAPDAYFYRIKATNAGGDSDYSNEESESSLVLGFNEIEDNKHVIYPNPSKGLFSVKFNHAISTSSISLKVFDMVGNRITVASIIDSDNQTLHLDLHQKSVGIYYLLLSVDGKTITSKLIKQ